jgi:hypothetical protein
MPGQVGPNPDNFAVVVSETVVDDAACGLNSHEPATLNRLIADLARRSDAGWELLVGHRSVFVPHEALKDASGKPIRGRIVRHELTYRRGSARRGWEYHLDALSDPEDPQVELMIGQRTAEGWTLVGCSRFSFEAVTPGVDHDELVHHTEDAVLIWKRSRPFGRRRKVEAAPG